MINIYDLNEYPFSSKNGTYGGSAGSKDGLFINNEDWLIKYPKSLSQMEGLNASYSTAPLSEYLGSHIYKILGFEVHETILGERNNKIVVGCKDFETEGRKLIEVRTLKNHTNATIDELIDEKNISSEETHTVDIDEILIHIKNNDILKNVPCLEQRFFEQILVDIFINNNDRNNGNWGIIRENGKSDTLAPIFDNGGCFNTKISEDKIKRLLSSPELINNATNVLTVYSKGEHQLNAKKLVKEIEDIPEFQYAVKKIVPIISSKLPEIFNMMEQVPSTHILKNGTEAYVFSRERKQLYKRQLEIRLEKIFIPLYEKYKNIEIPPTSISKQNTNDLSTSNKDNDLSSINVNKISLKKVANLLTDFKSSVAYTFDKISEVHQHFTERGQAFEALANQEMEMSHSESHSFGITR